MKKFQLLALVVLVILSACKKTKTVNALDYLLTSKPWKIATVDNNPATNPKGTVLYAASPNCMLDDTFAFDNNGEILVRTGKNHCDPNEGESFILYYYHDKTGNSITIDNKTYKIAELSDTQLKYYLVTPTATGFQNEIHIYQH